MFCKKVQPPQGLICLFINAYFLTQQNPGILGGRREGQNGCPFIMWEKEGHLKISSISRLGTGSSPQGDIPPSALLLQISRASEKLEDVVAGERLEKQGAT